MLGEGDAVHPRAVRRLSAITMDEAKLKGCRRGGTSNQDATRAGRAAA
jgi:hypothetical protein